ncbi:MAG: hypothetical protein KIT73_19920, partial [Burkholderiales bacterium]|nr:hypothetical protein [Burkholderiales bacterium]
LPQGAQLFLLLDGFERFLKMAPTRRGVAAFETAWLAVLNRPDPRIRFLLSMRDGAETALARYHDRIPGLGDATLRLPPLARAAAGLHPEVQRRHSAQATAAPLHTAHTPPVASAAASTPPEPAPAASVILPFATPHVFRHRRRTAPPAPSASIEAPTPSTAAPERPADTWAALEAAIVSAPPGGSPSPTDGAGPTRLPGRRIAFRATVLGIAVAAVATVLALREPPVATNRASAPMAVAETPGESAPHASRQIATPTDSATVELARFVDPATELLPPDQPLRNLATLRTDGANRLAIVPYDALQRDRDTLRTEAARRSDPLRIVAPLHTDAVHFVVRSDAPLRSVRDIRGQRINVGTTQGAAALTTDRVHQLLFGTTIPTADLRHLDDDAALHGLIIERSVDVVVLLGTPPVAALAQLPPEQRQRIRILGIDRADPANRRALARYLSLPVRPPNGGEVVTALGVMNFLVGAAQRGSGEEAHLATVAASLCRNLPALRSQGHARWRDVQPTQRFDAGLPYVQFSDRMPTPCDHQRAEAPTILEGDPT